MYGNPVCITRIRDRVCMEITQMNFLIRFKPYEHTVQTV